MLYQAQLADELPMILVASYANFVLYDTKPGFGLGGRSVFLMAALVAFNLLFIWS